MLDQILWFVFLFEWLIGVAVGWLIAYFYWRIGNPATMESLESGQERVSLSKSPAKGSNPTAAVLSALATDRTAAQAALNARERELAETRDLLNSAKHDLALRTATQAALDARERELAETRDLLDTVKHDLAFAREARIQAEAALEQRGEETTRLKASLAETQADNATLAANFAKYRRAAAEAEALAKQLDRSRADLSATTIKLQTDLDAAIKSRQNVEQQLTEHKQRFHTVTADLTAAHQNQASLKAEIQARDHQINDLLATVARLQDDSKGHNQTAKKSKRTNTKRTETGRLHQNPSTSENPGSTDVS